MTNLYVFWKKSTDPPSPWTRLTRTNQYLRFNGTPANHWSQTGATTHIHPSGTAGTTGTTFGTAMTVDDDYSPTEHVMVAHYHGIPSYDVDANNNNPPGFGLDIIYMDLTTWETSVRSFPEGSIIMSNGALVDASLERYSAADGRYIVHATPESTVGTTTPQSHVVSGTTDMSDPLVGSLYCSYSHDRCDAHANHNHTFSLASEAKYVEPRNLVTRLYHALQNTSKAVDGSVVFVDGLVGANWEILTGWAGGNLKAGNSDPALSGSDTHEQTFSGNSSVYNGPAYFYNRPGPTAYDNHYHAISGTLSAASHVPSSRLIVPARLVKDLIKSRTVGAPQIIGLW